MNIPADLLYTEHDEWIRLDGDEIVTGITDFAQDQLTDIVYVELPDVGDRFDAGEAFGVVESVKAAADMYMPVSGEITGVNEELQDAPELVNQSPYNEGWLVRIRPDDMGILDELMDAGKYQARVEAQG